MTNIRLSLPTVLVIAGVVGAGAFAAGRSMTPASSSSVSSDSTPPASPAPQGMPLATSDTADLPPGHPPTMGGPGAMGAPGTMGAPGPMGPSAGGAEGEPKLQWKAPPRWQSAPNTSSMRLATFRIPRAPGDSDDAELSVMQAGGTVDANAERWIGQFDAAGQKTAKRSTRKVGTLDVTIVEVQGTYSGGMGKDPSSASGWALLGAIVSTPGMPHFFKLTGPAKTVQATRAEFDAFLASLAPR